MNPFRKILNLFKKKEYWTKTSSALFGETPNQPTNRDFLDSYEASFLVNACVRKIAEKVANTKFKLYKVDGRSGKEKIREVESHPILDLLAQVNPFVTKFEMMDDTQTYMELLGNSYWLKIRGERSRKPLEIWQLRPDWVKIIEDPEKIIKEYEYRLPNGTVERFAPEDIIHFKQPNPKSSFYGLPTVKAAMEVIRTAIFTTRWNMNFFYNQARPDALLISKTNMEPEEKKELAKEWEQKYKGVDNAHRLGILEGEYDYKILNFNMRDMEFPKLQEITTQDILAAFGVPKSIIGLQGMNRAEAEAQVYVFLSETIEPKIRRIVERLNEFLVPEYGDNLYLDFVDPTPANREAITKEYESALKNNWMVINEVRDLENLPPLEGGWDFYLPITMTPAGKSEEGQKAIKAGKINPKAYYKMKEERSQEALRKKMMVGKRKFKLEMQLKQELRKLFIKTRTKPLTKEDKRRFWEEHKEILTGDQKLCALLTRRLLKSQEGRVQEALKDQFGKKAKYDLVDWKMEDKIFIELSLPLFTDIAERRGKRAAELIGSEFVVDDATNKIIKKKSFEFADKVNSTTRKKLKVALAEGIANGEGVDKLSERVSELFKEREKWETVRIARTEVADISGRAQVEAYKQSGVVKKKEWLISASACSICAPLSGEIVDVDKTFPGGYYCEPVHPNCTCTTIPVIET